MSHSEQSVHMGTPASSGQVINSALPGARLERVGWKVFVWSIGIALVAATPLPWIPFASLKLAIMAVGFALAALLLIGSWWRTSAQQGSVSLCRSLRAGRAYAAAIGLIPLAYIISYALSTANGSIGLLGAGSEVDTLFFVLLAYVGFVLSLAFVNSAARVRTLIKTMVIAIAIAIAFQYVSILLGGVLWAKSAFSDKTVNLIGKWNDLAMATAFVALVSLVRAEFSKEVKKRCATMRIIGLLLSGVLLSAISFDLAWWFVGAGALIIAAVKFFNERAQRRAAMGVADTGTASQRNGRAWYAYVAIVISIIFVIFGSSINSHLPSILSITSLEVRPSLSTTYGVARNVEDNALHTLFGAGPNTFGAAWVHFKPISVNLTQFWNVDFVTGFSTISTALASVGVVGVIAWLIPLIMLALLLARATRLLRNTDPADVVTVLSLLLVTSFMWLTLALYAPSQSVALLAFVFFGALAGYLTAVQAVHIEIKTKPVVRGVATVVCVVAMVALVFLPVRRLVALSYQGQALVATSNGDVDGAVQSITASQNVERTPDNMRIGAEVNLSKLQKIANTAVANMSAQDTAALRTSFQNTLVAAIQEGQTSTQLSPTDYRPYVDLAHIYEFLYPLQIAGAYDGAVQAYQSAIQLNPTSPALPLLLAQLEATADLKGNLSDVEKLITQSLQLKGNFTDAFLLAEKIEVAQNNLPGATSAVAAAVQSAPDQAPLWLELGILNYSAGNLQNAIPALEQAITLVPTYANAKYFLGLAYYKEGRTQDAISLFTQLVKDNPGNTDVAHILQNMQWGIDPFAGTKGYTQATSTYSSPISR